MFTNAEVIFLEEVTSTNDEASALIAAERATDGMLVLANFQSNGRGQRGNSWQSTRGQNILMSLILKPWELQAQSVFALNMCVSCGVYDYVTAKTKCKVHIKWPNDILIDGKKSVGILIENTLRGNSISWSVAGIGVNLNQETFEKELSQATSLYQLTGIRYNSYDEAVELRNKIGYWYLMLRSNKVDEIVKAYHQRLFGLDQLRSYKLGGNVTEGFIRGVDSAGRLMLEKKNGEFVFSDIKEVEYIWE